MSSQDSGPSGSVKSTPEDHSLDSDLHEFNRLFGNRAPPVCTYHIPWMKFSPSQRPIVLENGLEPFSGYYPGDRVCIAEIVRQRESKNIRKKKKNKKGKLNLLTEGLKEIKEGPNSGKKEEDDCEDFLDPNGFLLPSEEDDESEEECKPDTSFPSSDLDKAENPKKAKTEGQGQSNADEVSDPTGNFPRHEHIFLSKLLSKYGYTRSESEVENVTEYKIFKEMMKLTQSERNTFQEWAEKIYPKKERFLSKNILKTANSKNRKLFDRIQSLPSRLFVPLQGMNCRSLIINHPDRPSQSSEFELIHEKSLLEMGTFIDCPQLPKNRSIFWPNSTTEMSDERTQNLPQDLGVAFDENCVSIVDALADKPDIVISSSALKRLYSNYCEAWIIPFVVKKHDSKKIIYFCKSMPFGPLKAIDKEKHFYKKSLTPNFTDKQSISESSRTIQPDNSIFDDGHFDISELETFGSSSKYSRISQFDGGCDSNSENEASTSNGRMLRSRVTKGSPNIVKPISNEVSKPNAPTRPTASRRAFRSYVTKTLFKENQKKNKMSKQLNNSSPTESLENVPSRFGANVGKQVFHQDPQLSQLPKLNCKPNQNVAYNMWNLTKKGEANGELVKLLIRNKCNAVKRLSDLKVVFSFKREHQPDLGVEEMTRNELADEWISTLTRPNSILLRHRVDIYSGKIIHSEERNLEGIERDDVRNKFRPTELLGNLHQIFKMVLESDLEPGMYLIKNAENRTSLPKFFKETSNRLQSNCLDISTKFSRLESKGDVEVVREPWMPLDYRVVLTPFPAPCLFKNYQFKIPPAGKGNNSTKKGPNRPKNKGKAARAKRNNKYNKFGP